MKIVPLANVPSQTLQIVLDGQDCDIDVFTRGDHLYLSLFVGGEAVQESALCLNLVSVIQIPNNLFKGTLSFVDTLGDSNPNYKQLADRFLLVYWSDGEEYAPVNRNPASVED